MSNKVTVIVTANSPIYVEETVDQLKDMLRNAKDNRSKFIYPRIKGGSACIVCVDIIAFVLSVLEEEEKSNLIKPNFTAPPVGGH